MRRSLWMLAVALGVIVAWSTGRLQAQGDKVTFAHPNHANFAGFPRKLFILLGQFALQSHDALETVQKSELPVDAMGMHASKQRS